MREQQEDGRSFSSRGGMILRHFVGCKFSVASALTSFVAVIVDRPNRCTRVRSTFINLPPACPPSLRPPSRLFMDKFPIVDGIGQRLGLSPMRKLDSRDGTEWPSSIPYAHARYINNTFEHGVKQPPSVVPPSTPPKLPCILPFHVHPLAVLEKPAMITFATAHNFLLGCVNGFAIFVVVGEVYAIRIMAVAGTAPVIPSMGLATALFTVMSIPAVSASPPDPFMKAVIFETIWRSILWLGTASLTPGMMKILDADACDVHVGDWRILCHIVLIPPEAVFPSRVSHIVFPSVLTVKAIIEGHPNAWMTSSLDIFTYSDGEDTDLSPKAAGDWIGNKQPTLDCPLMSPSRARRAHISSQNTVLL
ncbi:hypothetical protein AB1N83_012347 [Pleurotus pulmonarius]